jgi:hypothetical protein
LIFFLKLLTLVIGITMISSLARSQDTIEDTAMLSVKSQFELVGYVNNLPLIQGSNWQRVEVLMDFESVPTKVLSYVYVSGAAPVLISLAGVPADIWNNFFKGHSVDDVLKPKQIQMTICRDQTERFSLAVHYVSTTFGGRKLNTELSTEDHLVIAAALVSDC